MAKFSQYTLNQVGGTDGQVLAQQLAYNQRDFWNFVWSNANSVNGWQTNTTPINLSGATISAQIIRRQLVDYGDTRCGLDMTIVDYPTPAAITDVTASSSITNLFTCTSTTKLYANQPVRFSGSVYGGVAINTTYYVKEIISNTTFSISDTSGGGTKALATATGTMTVDRVAPTAINLPISNRNDAAGAFTVSIDDSTWNLIAGDPDLDINADNPACFTGRVKVSFPVQGANPAYDQIIFLLFLITSDGVIN